MGAIWSRLTAWCRRFTRRLSHLGSQGIGGQALALAHNHGTAFKEIFDLVREDSSLAAPLPGTRVLRAEVVHAVRMEMALTLDDVVNRRTDLGLEGRPAQALEEAAYLIGSELGWRADRTRREVALAVGSPLPVATSPVAEHARA